MQEKLKSLLKNTSQQSFGRAAPPRSFSLVPFASLGYPAALSYALGCAFL